MQEGRQAGRQWHMQQPAPSMRHPPTASAAAAPTSSITLLPGPSSAGGGCCRRAAARSCARSRPPSQVLKPPSYTPAIRSLAATRSSASRDAACVLLTMPCRQPGAGAGEREGKGCLLQCWQPHGVDVEAGLAARGTACLPAARLTAAASPSHFDERQVGGHSYALLGPGGLSLHSVIEFNSERPAARAKPCTLPASCRLLLPPVAACRPAPCSRPLWPPPAAIARTSLSSTSSAPIASTAGPAAAPRACSAGPGSAACWVVAGSAKPNRNMQLASMHCKLGGLLGQRQHATAARSHSTHSRLKK